MALLDTGFGRTITASGVLTLPASSEYIPGGFFEDGVTAYVWEDQSSIAIFSAFINAANSQILAVPYTPLATQSAGTDFLFSAQVETIQDPISKVINTSVKAFCGMPSASSNRIETNVSGTPAPIDYSFTFQTEFWATAVGSYASLSGSYGTNFGRNSGETQTGVGFNVVERLVAGSTWILTVAGVTVSGTVQASDVTGFVLDPASTYNAYLSVGTFYGIYNGGNAGNHQASPAASATMAISFGGVSLPITAPYAGIWKYPGVGSVSTVSYDFTSGVSVTTFGLGIYEAINTEWCAGGWFAIPKVYNVTGEILAMDEEHPKSWTCSANALPNPAAADDSAPIPAIPFQGPVIDTGDIFFPDFLNLGLFSLDNGVHPILLVKYQLGSYGIATWITRASMQANGENVTSFGAADYLIPVRCRSFDALTVDIATQAIWDDLSKADRWYRGGGASSPAGYPNTTQVGSNQIQFDLTQDSLGNPPTQNWVSGLYPATVVNPDDVQQPDISFYRFLYLELQAAAGSSLAISIQVLEGLISQPDKIFDVTITTNGVFQPILIDLCAPVSGGPGFTAFQQDSAFTYYGLTPGAGMKNEWGVQLVAGIRLNLALGGQQFIIQNLRVQQAAAPRWNWLLDDSHVSDWPTSVDSPFVLYPSRSLSVDCDGRRAEAKGIYVNPTYPFEPPELVSTIDNVVAELGAKLGVTISKAAPTAWYVGLAQSIGGNGRIFPGSKTSWIDNPFQASPPNIEGNAQGIGLTCPPYCGDIFGLSGYSPAPTNVYVQKTMRGRVTGIALDPSGDGQPLPGATIELLEGVTPCGTDTSDSLGRYLTGEPFATIGPIAPSVVSGSFNYLTGLSQRLIRRICPLGTPNPEKMPWHWFDATGAMWQLSVDASGNVKARRCQIGVPVGGWDSQVEVTSTNDCEWPKGWTTPQHFFRTSIVFGRVVYSGTMLVSTDVWTCFTDDDGQSWSAPTLLMANARYPFGSGYQQDGSEMTGFAEYLTGTSGPMNIYTQYRAAGDGNWSSPTQVLDQTGSPIVVEDTGFGNAWPGPSQHGPWTLSIVKNGDTYPNVWISDDNGKSFIKITSF